MSLPVYISEFKWSRKTCEYFSTNWIVISEILNRESHRRYIGWVSLSLKDTRWKELKPYLFIFLIYMSMHKWVWHWEELCRKWDSNGSSLITDWEEQGSTKQGPQLQKATICALHEHKHIQYCDPVFRDGALRVKARVGFIDSNYTERNS